MDSKQFRRLINSSPIGGNMGRNGVNLSESTQQLIPRVMENAENYIPTLVLNNSDINMEIQQRFVTMDDTLQPIDTTVQMVTGSVEVNRNMRIWGCQVSLI